MITNAHSGATVASIGAKKRKKRGVAHGRLRPGGHLFDGTRQAGALSGRAGQVVGAVIPSMPMN